VASTAVGRGNRLACVRVADEGAGFEFFGQRPRPRGGERRVEADAAGRGEYFVILALTAVFENMLSNLLGG